MNMLKACFDWRVITALAAVGVGIFLLAPDIVGFALPLLLVAACPLSMILMMKSMGGHEATTGPVMASKTGDRADRLRAELAVSRREQHRLMRELEELDGDPALPARATPSSPQA